MLIFLNVAKTINVVWMPLTDSPSYEDPYQIDMDWDHDHANVLLLIIIRERFLAGGVDLASN